MAQKFQIRDTTRDFGLALVEAQSAELALTKFVADRMAADGQVAVLGLRTHRDGLAETTYGGVRYTARAVQS